MRLQWSFHGVCVNQLTLHTLCFKQREGLFDLPYYNLIGVDGYTLSSKVPLLAFALPRAGQTVRASHTLEWLLSYFDQQGPEQHDIA